MGKKKDDSGWWLAALVTLVGVGILYYVQTGKGKENDDALIPNDLEGQVDLVVAKLNERFGKNWVDLGLAVLRDYLQTVVPPPLVDLVDVVISVEQLSKITAMSSSSKQRQAIKLKRGW